MALKEEECHRKAEEGEVGRNGEVRERKRDREWERNNRGHVQMQLFRAYWEMSLGTASASPRRCNWNRAC